MTAKRRASPKGGVFGVTMQRMVFCRPDGWNMRTTLPYFFSGETSRADNANVQLTISNLSE
jgi:hypothetical protein